MTATAHIADQPVRLSQTGAVAASHDVKVWAGTMAGVLGIFLLIQNPYWVPAGDSELYTAIARSLANGEGYLFNGQVVRMVPPGWPILLAAAMKISPTFLFLKLTTMLYMLAALGIWYWIMRRFASPVQSAGAVLLTAILSHVYQATFWLTSEASFCFVSALAILLAMQIAENPRGHVWRIVLLVFLCAVGVTIRWTGVLTWLLVAAALLKGRILPRFNRYWLTAALTGAVALGTLFGLRYVLNQLPSIPRVAVAGDDEPDGGAMEEADERMLDQVDSSMTLAYSFTNPAAGGMGMLRARGLTWAHWFSYLLWQPLRLGQSDWRIALPSLMVGWVVVLLLLMVSIGSMRRLNWFWPALILYTLVLALEWNHPNARYLVPVAPLVILGVFKAFEMISARFSGRWVKRGCALGVGAFVTAIIVCNGTLYAVDLGIARSSDYYGNYDAGIDKNLIAIAKWLNERQVQDAQIAVSQRYTNMGRTRRWNPFGLRATMMLTGRSIRGLPDAFTRGDPMRNREFLPTMRRRGVKYVVFLPRISPWRVYHFRMPGYQYLRTGEMPLDNDGWQLFVVPSEGRFPEKITLPPVTERDWPTRVPGL